MNHQEGDFEWLFVVMLMVPILVANIVVFLLMIVSILSWFFSS